jgi:hypothetical protein
MDDQENTGHMRRVGVLWKPREGAKSLGSGSVTVNGLRQRFVILRNDKKREGSSQPDYVLLSADPPEVDEYEHRRANQPRSRAAAPEAPPW